MDDGLSNLMWGMPGITRDGGAFIDLFDRSNGALGSDYTDSDSYTIASFAAHSTPILGTEILNNTGFEGSYVGGIAPNWTVLGSGTPTEETTIVYSGSSAQKLVASASNDRVCQTRNVLEVGSWYRVSAWVRTPVPGISNVRLRVGTSTSNAAYGSAICTATDTWQEVSITFRATGSSCTVGIWLLAGAVAYVDEMSFKKITTTDMFALRKTNRASLTLQTAMSLGDSSHVAQGGLVCRMSADKANGVVAWIDKTNATANLSEIVNGVWTTTSQSVTVVSGAILRVHDDGASEVKVYYNDALVITGAVSTVVANDRLYCGVMCTAPEISIYGLILSAYGMLPYVYRYVSTGGNDANAGSSGSPRLTLNGAGLLKDANKLITHIGIYTGTYTENVICRANTTYIALGSVTIDGNNVSHGFYANSTDNVTISGFTVINSSADQSCILLNNSDDCIVEYCSTTGGNYGIQFQNNSHRPTIRYCTISGAVARGVGIYNGCEEAEVSYCYIHSGGDTDCYGLEIELNCDDSVISYTWVTEYSHGFIAKLCDGITFDHCVAYSNSSLGFYSKGSTNTTLTGCDSSNNDVGLKATKNDAVAPYSTGLTLQDCIITGNATNGVYIQTDSEVSASLDYNDYYDNGDCHWAGIDCPTLTAWQTVSSQDANSQAVDPDYLTEVYNGFVPQATAVLTGALDGGPQGHTG